MLKSDVIAHFGSVTKTAEALDISPAAVSLWKEVIPQGSAYKIESVTKRALRVNPKLYSESAIHSRRTHASLQS